jgi:hypothetical protein
MTIGAEGVRCVLSSERSRRFTAKLTPRFADGVAIDALSEQYCSRGAEKNGNVETERCVLNIPQIERGLVMDGEMPAAIYSPNR